MRINLAALAIIICMHSLSDGLTLAKDSALRSNSCGNVAAFSVFFILAPASRRDNHRPVKRHKCDLIN
jgi:hypothetical protein